MLDLALEWYEAFEEGLPCPREFTAEHDLYIAVRAMRESRIDMRPTEMWEQLQEQLAAESRITAERGEHLVEVEHRGFDDLDTWGPSILYLDSNQP